MTLRRKILLGLLVLPAAAALLALLWPGMGAELVFLFIGVPILVLNAREFFLGENGSSVFDLSRRPASSEGSIMKSKLIVATLILSLVFLLLVAGYTISRSVVDEVPYSLALYTFLIKLGTKLWHYLSKPVILMALLFFVLLLVLGPRLLSMLRERGSTTAAPFPDGFRKPVQSPFAAIAAESEENEGNRTMERMIGEGVDLKAIRLMLEVDGIDMTKPALLAKMSALELQAEGMAANASPVQREAFYRGVLEGLYGYLFPLFCTIETKDEERAVRVTLKPGVRARLVERLNQGNKPAEAVAA